MTIRSRMCALGLGVMVLVAAPAEAATGSTDASRAQVAVARYSFDSSDDGTLAVTGEIVTGPGALFTMVDVDVSGGTAQAFFPTVIDLGDPSGVRSFGALGQRNVCQSPVLECSVTDGVFSFGTSFSVHGDGRHKTHLRQYLAIRGAKVKITDVALNGWHARHRTRGLTTRSDQDASGAGVDLAGTDAGVTTGVSAPGPAAGSVGILVPNCDPGAGAFTFTGGPQPQTVLCPSATVAAYARRRTTWGATGAGAGVGPNQTRLVVIAA